MLQFSNFIKKKKLLIPLIFFVILISGCSTNQSQTSSGTGLVIEKFESDIKGVDINPGEELRFTLTLRNTGSEKARDIKASIIGLDGWSEPRWIDCSAGSIGDLLPANPEYNLPSQATTCTIVANAPENPALSQSFQPKVSVIYQYDSSTIANIKLPSREKFIVRQDSGQPFESEILFRSRSPIDIVLDTRGEASQLRVLRNKDVIFPLFIKINNIGGGSVCETYADCLKTLKKIELRTESGSPSKLVIDTCQSKQTIDLFKGQSGELKCDLIALSGSDLSAEDLVSVTISSKNYGYSIEQSGQQINVKRDIKTR